MARSLIILPTMNNNEIAPITQAPTLAQYNPRVDLVAIRRDAVTYPRINATPRDQAVAKMFPIVYAAFLYRGQQASQEILQFIAQSLVDEIMADTHFGLPTLSWLEIGMVIRKAVLGGAREMFGVSVATLYAALVDYARNEGHEASRQAYNR